MQKTDLSQANCPIARTLGIVGEWWSLLIIRQAFLGVTRFDDFQRSLGISRNALADRLKTLVQGGVLARKPVSEGARREEYVLTEMGADLITVVVAMLQWGHRWLIEPGCESMRLVERTTGQDVARLEIRSQDGRRLHRREIKVAGLGDPGDLVKPADAVDRPAADAADLPVSEAVPVS